jgi:hypothetical protein
MSFPTEDGDERKEEEDDRPDEEGVVAVAGTQSKSPPS